MSFTTSVPAHNLAGLGIRNQSAPNIIRVQEQPDGGYEADGEHEGNRAHHPHIRSRPHARRCSLPTLHRAPSYDTGLGLGLPSALFSRSTRRRVGAEHSHNHAAQSHSSSATDDTSDISTPPPIHTPTDAESTTTTHAVIGLGLGLPVELFMACHARNSSSDAEMEADALATYSFLPPGLSTPIPSPMLTRNSTELPDMSRRPTTLGTRAMSESRTVMPGAPRIAHTERFDSDPTLY